MYGVVNVYAVFQPHTPIPSSLPSHILEIVNADTPLPISQYPPLQDSIGYLTSPWIKARVTLGLMARWKALYMLCCMIRKSVKNIIYQ